MTMISPIANPLQPKYILKRIFPLLLSTIVLTTFLLGLDNSHSSDLSEYRPPIETGRALSREELRYCKFETVRLESARNTLESNSNKLGSRHSRAFNAAIEDYNLRCSNYQYYEDDNKAIDADIALRLPHLVIEGNDLERLVRWHQQLLWHVTVEILNLRDAPSTSGAVISRLDKYKDVIRTGSPREGWLPVRVGELTGYASLHYLSRGSGAETKRLECLAAAGTSPTSGEILAGSLNGPNMIHVSNGLKADALFKLKRRDRSTALSFFVEAGDDVEIQHIADGDYQLTFATGLNFNRSWNRFCSKPSRPRAFESYEPFKSTATSYTSVELTLHPIPSGNSAAREVDEQEEYFFWED